MLDKEVTRAGFGPRAAAYLIDRALLFLAVSGLQAPFRIAAFLGADGLMTKDFLFRFSALDVLSWILVSAYFVLLTYFSGSTLGKKIMRLSVQKADGAPLRFIDVLYRETVGRFLSGILCIGYLMVLVDRQNRGFHDWLCDTCVVYDEVRFRRREKAGGAPDEVPAAPSWSVPGERPAAPAAEAALPEPADEGNGEA